MSITMKSKPKRRETVDSQTLPDGSGLLFDSATATAYPITESAARIWELCDGEHDVGSIIDELEAHYDVDRATLEADSRKLLEELVEKQLLDLSADVPE
jgi:Coenzyme PQQ synthesis protein D (PqqD)